ncbi:MAG: hypothetical protein ACFFCG_03650, partial [Promethearchaeota archaeon]
NKKTVGLIFPGKIEDKGTNTIRLDSYLRRNINATVNDLVEINKINAPLAEKLGIIAYDKNVIAKKESIKQFLKNRAVSKGYIFRLGTPPNGYDFAVYMFVPKGTAVRIGKNTEIQFHGNTYIELLEWKEKSKLENVVKKLEEIAYSNSIIELDEFQLIMWFCDELFYKYIFKWAKEFNFKIENKNLIYNKEGMLNFIRMLQKEYANLRKENKIPDTANFSTLTLNKSGIFKFPDEKEESFKNSLKKLREIAEVTSQIQINELKSILGLEGKDYDVIFDQKLYEWAKQFNFRFELDHISFEIDDDVLNFISMLENKFTEWQNICEKKNNGNKSF